MGQKCFLTELAGGWTAWSWTWLRAAGFPAQLMLGLGSDELAAAIAERGEANADAAAAQRDVLVACERVIATGDPPRVMRAEGVVRTLARGKIVAQETRNPEVDERLAVLRERAAVRDRAEAAFVEILARTRTQIAEQLIAHARDPKLREAVLWQNRDAAHNALDRHATSTPSDTSSRTREHQRTIAKYLQRYTLKNDTIGFFGPVAWSRLDRGEPGVALTPGPLVAARDVHLEDWAVEAFAEQLAYSPELVGICTLRLKPFSWIEDGTLHRPPAPPQPLDEPTRHLLALAADAPTIDVLVARSSMPRDEALATIAEIRRTGLALCAVELPAERAHKERQLRILLETAHPGDARTEALAQLAVLEAARAQVAAAAGDPPALDEATGVLVARFTEITARAATRGHGSVYAGRQVYYEDCVRGGALVIGATVLDRIAAPLALVLASARWFTYEIAMRYRAAFAAAYRQQGAREVPLGRFLLATAELFGHQKGTVSPIVASASAELRRRWASLLPPHGRMRSVEIAPRVAELFAAPCPGWPTARYQAPDLLLAAASVEALSAGQFTPVLGELHAGVNTLLARCARDLHPDPDELDRNVAAELGVPCVQPVQPTADRTSSIIWSAEAFHVELDRARSWRQRDRVLAGGDLYVVDDHGLQVRARSRDLGFDIIQFMDHYLSAEASPHFRIAPDAAHTPRIALDELVVARERWRFDRSELASLVGERCGFAEVAAWAHERALPRFVFAVVPTEAKPFYVDFASPICVELFQKFIARSPALSLSEMLPAHGEHWLSDETGARYTSELRIAAVDPVPWTSTTTTT